MAYWVRCKDHGPATWTPGMRVPETEAEAVDWVKRVTELSRHFNLPCTYEWYELAPGERPPGEEDWEDGEDVR